MDNEDEKEIVHRRCPHPSCDFCGRIFEFGSVRTGKIKIPILSKNRDKDERAYAGAPKRTETSFETPGSCMVTP